MVKRLLALGTGAAMLGATTMGALAAVDLKSYPDMFVKDGTFDGVFVVGEKAAAVDNLAMTDIAASMKYKKASGAATTTVTGDNWRVATSSKKYELVNSNASSGTNLLGETFNAINTFIGDEDLVALADGKWATNENDYTYQQFLFFDAEPVTPNNRIVKQDEDDDDTTADFLFFRNGQQMARYRLEFTSTAKSDVTDSTGAADTTGTYLDDFEDTSLSLFGKQHTVVIARRPAAAPTSDSVRLVLMSGANTDTLLEGESKTYDVKGTSYDVSSTFVDADECKFTVNGEATNKLKDGDTFVLADKTEIGVSEVLYQDYAGGVHSCTFFLGAQKMELRDDDTSNSISSHNLKVGSEDIDGAAVIIEGTDDNTSSSISVITLNMTAQDDYFVGKNGKLSEEIKTAGDEHQVLFNGGFDIEYSGISEEKTHDLKLKTSGSRRYDLDLYDGDGNKVSIPVAYGVGNGNVTLGRESWTGTRANQKRLRLTEGDQIAKDDYFVVSAGTPSDGSAKSFLLSYSGSDRQTRTSPKIKFKNLGNAETLEYSVTSLGVGTTGTVATIKLGGFSFLLENRSSTLADDFTLAVDADGGGAVGTNTMNFIDSYGSQWAFAWNISGGDATTGTTTGLETTGPGVGSPGNATNPNWISLTQTTPNADDYDNVVPSTLILNLTSTSDPEVRAAQTGLVLITPDGQTNVGYGYTSMGTYIKYETPSGDPQEITMTYPELQRLPQVFVTSGATSTSTAASGDLTAVTIVDATKLDSEVASLTAQNVVAVGGPCVNTVAAELLGNPADCTTGFAPGKARVKLFEHANGKVAMLVAGYSGADTRLAGKVVSHRASELTGMEVEVEGTTYSDATISAPTAS